VPPPPRPRAPSLPPPLRRGPHRHARLRVQWRPASLFPLLALPNALLRACVRVCLLREWQEAVRSLWQ